MSLRESACFRICSAEWNRESVQQLQVSCRSHTGLSARRKLLNMERIFHGRCCCSLLRMTRLGSYQGTGLRVAARQKGRDAFREECSELDRSRCGAESCLEKKKLMAAMSRSDLRLSEDYTSRAKGRTPALSFGSAHDSRSSPESHSLTITNSQSGQRLPRKGSRSSASLTQ